MVRGMSRCRICGKPVPSIYRKNHEQIYCLKMRFDRGDSDVVARFLAKGLPHGPLFMQQNVEPAVPGQKRLFSVPGVQRE